MARSLASLAEAFRRVARTSDGGWLEERDHVVRIATGMTVGAFNPTFVVAPPRDPEAAVAGVRAFYARAGLPGEISASGDAASLRTFNDVCAEAFGLDRKVLAVLDDPRMLEVQGFGFHLGLPDGHAVGTAMTCCIDGVVLIFNVATRPSHRRRGIGEAMTSSAVDHGIEAGCDLAFLQASRDGLPLYERMGFQHVMEMATWSLA